MENKKKLSIEETDKILNKIRDSGFEIIDLQRDHKEQMDIFNIQTISEEYFNEKINEALEGEADYCSNCKKYVSQVDVGGGSFGCPICKRDDCIEIH